MSTTHLGPARAAMLVAGLLAVTTIAGCSQTAPDSAADSEFTTITFINPAPAQDSWKGIEKCFVEAAEAAGITTKVVGSPGANTQTSDQLRFIEQAVAEGADGIAGTSFTSDTGLEAAYQTAQDRGIVIATMLSGDATQARNFDVGVDIVKFGQDMADQVASRAGGHKVAILLPGLSGTPKIFSDAFQERAASYDNVDIIQTLSDDGVVTDDADLVGGLLTAHPDVTDIVTVNPGSSSGVATAIRERGKIGQVFLTGNSIAEPAASALDDGTAAAFYVQRKCDVGRLLVENMIAAHNGDDVARNVPIETKFVTKENYRELDLTEWS